MFKTHNRAIAPRNGARVMMQFAQRANKTSPHIPEQTATNAALNTTHMDSWALVPTSLVCFFHLHKTNEHKGATRAHPYALPEPQSPPHPISKMSRACGCFYTHHRSLHPRPVGASMVPTPFRSSHPWPPTTYRTTPLLGGGPRKGGRTRFLPRATR